MIACLALSIGFDLFSQEGRKGVRIKEMKANSGNRWAICIGINDYEEPSIIDLKKARADAKELAVILKQYGQFDEVFLMTDDLKPRNENYPKLRNIKRKLSIMKGSVKPEDLVLFFFSGHGISNPGGEGFLLTADTYSEDMFESSLKISKIVEWLKAMKVKKSLLIFDACREKIQGGSKSFLNRLKEERFRQAEVSAAFYSTKSGGFSYEDNDGAFGVFTSFLLEGLRGKADGGTLTGSGDGIVTLSELTIYVEKGVSNWAKKNGKRQKPYTKLFREKFGDLALSLYKNDSIRDFPGVKVPLRANYKTLTFEKVQAMLKKRNFYDRDFNVSGNFENLYEARTVENGRVVIDQVTGLMWHRSGSEKNMRYEEAKRWIRQLNRERYAGFDGWRFPTLEEGASLLESGKNMDELFIDPRFSGVQKYIWTGDTFVNWYGAKAAWVVFFSSGCVHTSYYNGLGYVRPVRFVR